MGNLARTIVVSGYYGYNNSGDEAVLHAIVTALRAEARETGVEADIVVLSGDPAATARLHGVKAAHRMRPLAVLGALLRADALVSGGGSLLQDVTSAKSMAYYLAVIRMALLLRKPVYVYAQGIGPIRNRDRFGPWIRSAFRASRYVSVRDEESKALLEAIGVPAERVEVVPDPVMGLGDAQAAAAGTAIGASAARDGASSAGAGSVRDGRGPSDGDASVSPERSERESARPSPRIGVSVRYWREDRQELETIAQALAAVIRREPAARVELLPFHLPSDREASAYVAERMAAHGVPRERVAVHSGTEHPAHMLEAVSSCDAVVGMRLHSLIYAAAAGVPPIGVSYDPKIDQFLKRLGETPAGSTDELKADELAEAVLLRLGEDKRVWYRSKATKIEEMRHNARKPAQQIFRDLRI